MILGSSSSLLGGRGFRWSIAIRGNFRAMRKAASRRVSFLRGRVVNGCVLKELIFSPFFFLCVFLFRKWHIHDTCICFRPHRPVRARFHVRFSVPWIYCNLTFFCIFQCFCTACARLVHADVANVLRLSRETIFVLESFTVCSWSATEWTASVHTLHMSKPVTCRC